MSSETDPVLLAYLTEIEDQVTAGSGQLNIGTLVADASKLIAGGVSLVEILAALAGL